MAPILPARHRRRLHSCQLSIRFEKGLLLVCRQMFSELNFNAVVEVL
jgi:hypothetical protein